MVTQSNTPSTAHSPLVDEIKSLLETICPGSTTSANGFVIEVRDSGHVGLTLHPHHYLELPGETVLTALEVFRNKSRVSLEHVWQALQQHRQL
ncbi:MAG: hypothetical protein U0903_00660 [Planctomycetales bacterium]